MIAPARVPAPVPVPAPRPAAAVLRRCACGGRAGPSRECQECRAKRLGLRRSASSSATASIAPPQVHDVLRSPGRPLDAATRAAFEPRFGHSFADVRIHADGRAAESAAAVSAHAYTVGRDVVFGAGRYAPTSMEGRRLIAHELAHVVQQSSSGSAALQPRLEVGAVDAPEERAAEGAAAVDASGQSRGNADAVIYGRKTSGTPPGSARDVTPQPAFLSGVLQRQPAQQPARVPPTYDRTPYPLATVSRQQTADNLRKLLAALGITSTIKGATGDEQIFLLSILYTMATKTPRNTEADVIIDIGWPPRAGAPAPRGQVTARIDSRGAATVELIARGVLPASRATTAADLQSRFKLASVKAEGSAKWTADQLNDVGEAFALLKADKSALKGVELIRVSTIPGEPDKGGQFEFPSSVAAKAENVNIRPKLRLADEAFANNAIQFSGGSVKRVPASFHTILHEVGHAVESEVYRTKWRAHAQALADVKAAGNVQESEARKKEREAIEEKLKTTTSAAQKKKLEKKLDTFELELAESSSKATDAKAAETKLKEKEKEVTDLDAAGQSQRLAKFVALATTNRIAPITKYARKGNGEFYAEAYALWRVDPEFLQTNYKDLFDFFESGDYRK